MKKFTNQFKEESIGLFLTSMFIFGIAMGLYGGIFNNFLAQMIHVNRFERGIVEFLRELPGLLLFLMLALLYRIPEKKIIRIAFFISLIGLLGLGVLVKAKWVAIAFVVIWSTGEHLLMPVRQSIAIHSAKPGHEGLAIGVTRGVGNIGSVIGYYLVSIIFIVTRKSFTVEQSFRFVFFLSALFVFFAFMFSSRLPETKGHVKRQKIGFQKKYTKYYILEIFFGARKQVFLTFAPYVLILSYGASTQVIATLYGIYSLINIFMNPIMGKLVDRLGYKTILIFDSIFLIILCFIYGFAHHIFPHQVAFYVICVVFILDAILFSVGIARAIYVKSLGNSQEELTTALSTGISVNHLISIVIALLGGLLWERVGIEVLFSLAAFFGFMSFVFTMTLPGQKQKN